MITTMKNYQHNLSLFLGTLIALALILTVLFPTGAVFAAQFGNGNNRPNTAGFNQNPETKSTQNLHNFDLDPAPLTEADLKLSLVGYGAQGALADEDLSIIDMLTYAAQDEYLALATYEKIQEIFGKQRP